jgi:flagellar basal-body rod modification protein FlgD
MQIPSDYSLDRLLAQQSSQAAAPNELGRDAFLQLLVTQLENQNPLTPLQDHEFIAQLASFSSLEQLQNIDQGIQVSVLMNQAVNNSLATNLIGKEVLTSGGTLGLGSSDGASFTVDLAADADVSVTIRDAGGNVVRRIDAGRRAAGQSTVEWDGLTDGGGRAAAGEYHVEVTAADGETPVSAATRMRAVVEGVRFVEGTGYLLVNGAQIPLSDVVEVLAPIGG